MTVWCFDDVVHYMYPFSLLQRIHVWASTLQVSNQFLLSDLFWVTKLFMYWKKRERKENWCFVSLQAKTPSGLSFRLNPMPTLNAAGSSSLRGRGTESLWASSSATRWDTRFIWATRSQVFISSTSLVASRTSFYLQNHLISWCQIQPGVGNVPERFWSTWTW